MSALVWHFVRIYGIAGDHCFASALYKPISNISVSMGTILHMIFNPLTLNDKSNIPLFETDPDIQFYYELSIIYNVLHSWHYY